MNVKLLASIPRTLAAALFLTLPAISSFAQSPTAQPAPSRSPTFITADVHASPKRLKAEVRGGISHGDRYYIKDATMVDLISSIYQVDPSSIFGGPAWLAFNRFDILAKAPAGTSEDSARLMVRALLADRFQLVAHTDTRPLPAFVLSAGKSPKLKPSAAGAEPGECQYQQQASTGPSAPIMSVKFSCHNTTMQTFVDFLHNVASPYLTRPVVDATGLKGGYDFDIQWSYQIPKDADGVTIFAAVDKQLGLKLEQKAAPLPVVTVVSVNEKPTPNVADIDKLLPPPPAAQFDVAVIKPANPDEKHFNIDADPSGRVTIQHASLQTLIYTSYDIASNNITNKPTWLDSDLWDILGKAAVDPNAGPTFPGANTGLDLDEVKEMERSLLADRFKLVAHMDTITRGSQVYALVAANPKMKKADPANHPSCDEGPGPDGKDPRIDNPLLNRLVTCKNMTMAELADRLRNIAGGYVPDPVRDMTGLDGAYDFTLSFTKKVDLNKTMPAPPRGDSTDASAPSDLPLSGLSVFDALQKQLGLKLEKKDMDHVTVPVLVIDHIEQKPTDN
jgi:uncharacterized protein (TIGR03435 family)